ncbi:MAG: hypothetical protein WAN22_26655, partial [Solirubrobacteraceae bacterium]
EEEVVGASEPLSPAELVERDKRLARKRDGAPDRRSRGVFTPDRRVSRLGSKPLGLTRSLTSCRWGETPPPADREKDN